jgi:hypothetical protein
MVQAEKDAYCGNLVLLFSLLPTQSTTIARLSVIVWCCRLSFFPKSADLALFLGGQTGGDPKDGDKTEAPPGAKTTKLEDEDPEHKTD